MLSHIKPRFIFVYILGLVFAFHVALSSYINSSFLGGILPENGIGIFYTLGSIVTFLTLVFLMPNILKLIGNYRLAVSLFFLELIALVGLAFSHSRLLLVLALFLSFITVSFVYYSIDIFLEGLSSDRTTGKIRGTYLTAMNFGWIFAPIIAGQIVLDGRYSLIYLTALIVLIPGFLLLILGLKNFKDTEYEARPFGHNVRSVFHNKNLRNIFGVNFLLHFFYSVMVIYTPIYLHKYIGLDWVQIGAIFSIMLIPFVLIQAPLGRLADRRLGEKEILFTGFLITIVSVAAISWIMPDSAIWVWALVLFLTRVGAASIEVMSDTYFFKKVDSLNSDTISLFRTAGPVAYILAPLLVSILLTYFGLELKYLFLILALVLILGLRFSLRLKDTL